jgi:hypothetical protein
MDRLIETVAKHQCRHKSVGLLRLTLDLTRRRLDIFAEIGAAEMVKGAAAPPTPGTVTWWRAAVNTVYVLRERGLAQYVREAEVASWTGLLTNPPPTKPPTAKNGALLRLFSRLRFRETPKNDVSILPNAE